MSLKFKAETTYEAIRTGNTEVLQFVLKRKFFIRMRRIFPLHEAVVHNNYTSLDIILKQGYSPNQDNGYDGTALHLAIIRDAFSVARWLISKGACIFKRNIKGENALSLAAKRGNDAFIKFVFRCNKISNNHPMINSTYGPYKETLLGKMTENIKLENGWTYRNMLVKGIDISAKLSTYPRRGESNNFLIRVATTGNNEFTLQLLKLVLKLHRAGKLKGTLDFNHIDQDGNTLLHMLAARGAVKCIELVLEHSKIHLNHTNSDQKTALNMALDNNKTIVIKYLINAGSDLYLKTLWCNVVPLDQAVYDDNARAARIILNAGFDLEKSINKDEIVKGLVPGIAGRDRINTVPTLFCLARNKIRMQLIRTNININWKVLCELPIPCILKFAIYSLVPDGICRKWQ